jgi:anti-sigma-K factor RskA
MSVHEQFAEDLALYALGALQGEERSLLEKHLEDCSACRLELQQLQGDMALLALSASGPAPPQRAKQQLLHAIEREPRMKIAPRRRLWSWVLPYAVAAMFALAAAFLWKQSDSLQQRVVELEHQASQQQSAIEEAKQVLATLTARDAMRVTLVAAPARPQPQGKAIYVRSRSSLIFLANNLEPLPPSKAYELWLIPVNGAPIPAGVFKPDSHGSATVVNPPLPPGMEAKTFAITIEPESGSTVPTMPIVMVGAGE